MNNPIRIGIIGCGRAAELIYLPLLLKHPDIVITSAVDPVKERREWIKSLIKNCRITETLDNAAITSIDAAIICSNPETHVPLADSLLKCNKYVLVEKPLATSLREIDTLLHTSGQSSAHLMMGFNHRYWTPIKRFREFLSEHNLINSVTDSEMYFSGNHNNWNPVSSRSDSLEDLGPHLLDLIYYLFGQQIYSISANSQLERHYNLNIKTAGGINIKAYIAHSDKTEKKITTSVGKSKYFIALGSERYSPETGVKRKMLDINDRIKRRILLHSSPIKKSYQLQLERYLQMIRTAKPEKPDIIDGIAGVKAVLAARLSIKRNEEVLLDEIQ